MPSAIETIRNGLLTSNLDMISDGFFGLTGERVTKGFNDTEVEVEKKKRGRKPKMKEDVVVPEPKRPRSKAPTKQEVDESIMVEEREQEEARTQKVVVGRKPKFISE